MNNIALYTLLSLLLMRCTADYTFESAPLKKRVVVEGLITSLQDSSRIILSYSSSDFRTASFDYITHATVSVSDGKGEVVIFNDALKKGKYTPYKGYAAKPGNTYRLSVLVDGITYEAEDRMPPAPPIQKLDFLEVKKGAASFTLKYQVRYCINKLKGKNYYRLIQYKDRKVYDNADENNRALIYADYMFKDKDNIITAPNYYSLHERVRIVLYSLSEQAYKFYYDLNNLENNDGGIFNAPAANTFSNISNGAMGFFQASDNSHKEIEINN